MGSEMSTDSHDSDDARKKKELEEWLKELEELENLFPELPNLPPELPNLPPLDKKQLEALRKEHQARKKKELEARMKAIEDLAKRGRELNSSLGNGKTLPISLTYPKDELKTSSEE